MNKFKLFFLVALLSIGSMLNAFNWSDSWGWIQKTTVGSTISSFYTSNPRLSQFLLWTSLCAGGSWLAWYLYKKYNRSQINSNTRKNDKEVSKIETLVNKNSTESEKIIDCCIVNESNSFIGHTGELCIATQFKQHIFDKKNIVDCHKAAYNLLKAARSKNMKEYEDKILQLIAKIERSIFSVYGADYIKNIKNLAPQCVIDNIKKTCVDSKKNNQFVPLSTESLCERLIGDYVSYYDVLYWALEFDTYDAMRKALVDCCGASQFTNYKALIVISMVLDDEELAKEIITETIKYYQYAEQNIPTILSPFIDEVIRLKPDIDFTGLYQEENDYGNNMKAIVTKIKNHKFIKDDLEESGDDIDLYINDNDYENISVVAIKKVYECIFKEDKNFKLHAQVDPKGKKNKTFR